jgi:hypothetical protein
LTDLLETAHVEKAEYVDPEQGAGRSLHERLELRVAADSGDALFRAGRDAEWKIGRTPGQDGRYKRYDTDPRRRGVGTDERETDQSNAESGSQDPVGCAHVGTHRFTSFALDCVQPSACQQNVQ